MSQVITEKVVKITAKFDDKLGMEPATFTVMNTNSEEHIRRNIDDLLPKEPYEIHVSLKRYHINHGVLFAATFEIN